jgi:urease accessory protein
VKAARITPKSGFQPGLNPSNCNASGMVALDLTCPKQPRAQSLPLNGDVSVRQVDPKGPASIGSAAAADWLVLQIADSAFPTGGFAHSSGLEAAWQQGEIRSPVELVDFVEVHLAQTGRAALPFVNEAYHEDRAFAELDRVCDVFLSNHVANRCSRAQGQAFLLAVDQAFDSICLKSFRSTVLKEKLPGHLAPVFGSVLRLLKISHSQCLRLFLFMSLRTLMASAVRIGAIGPMAAQSIQWRLARDAEQIAVGCAGIRVTDAAQTSPLLDIWQGAHDRLYSRLFQT